ncbi:MAG: hypothetical protein IJI36_05190 [Kiritimatiellae bacterium]|nr:hypothetical protein [Kiritimatiellia bacterium]
MNAASALVLAAVVAGAAAVVWRNLRKGAPCSCGEDCGCCGRDCHCRAPYRRGCAEVKNALHMRKEI